MDHELRRERLGHLAVPDVGRELDRDATTGTGAAGKDVAAQDGLQPEPFLVGHAREPAPAPRRDHQHGTPQIGRGLDRHGGDHGEAGVVLALGRPRHELDGVVVRLAADDPIGGPQPVEQLGAFQPPRDDLKDRVGDVAERTARRDALPEVGG